ncbi:hypothetical protein SNEBB_001917 [Seison nebaliae]|nr:hypothetical protein SNEBB_001917 [Seison nebaliae]
MSTGSVEYNSRPGFLIAITLSTMLLLVIFTLTQKILRKLLRRWWRRRIRTLRQYVRRKKNLCCCHFSVQANRQKTDRISCNYNRSCCCRNCLCCQKTCYHKYELCCTGNGFGDNSNSNSSIIQNSISNSTNHCNTCFPKNKRSPCPYVHCHIHDKHSLTTVSSTTISSVEIRFWLRELKLYQRKKQSKKLCRFLAHLPSPTSTFNNNNCRIMGDGEVGTECRHFSRAITQWLKTSIQFQLWYLLPVNLNNDMDKYLTWLFNEDYLLYQHNTHNIRVMHPDEIIRITEERRRIIIDTSPKTTKNREKIYANLKYPHFLFLQNANHITSTMHQRNELKYLYETNSKNIFPLPDHLTEVMVNNIYENYPIYHFIRLLQKRTIFPVSTKNKWSKLNLFRKYRIVCSSDDYYRYRRDFHANDVGRHLESTSTTNSNLSDREDISSNLVQLHHLAQGPDFPLPYSHYSVRGRINAQSYALNWWTWWRKQKLLLDKRLQYYWKTSNNKFGMSSLLMRRNTLNPPMMSVTTEMECVHSSSTDRKSKWDVVATKLRTSKNMHRNQTQHRNLHDLPKLQEMSYVTMCASTTNQMQRIQYYEPKSKTFTRSLSWPNARCVNHQDYLIDCPAWSWIEWPEVRNSFFCNTPRIVCRPMKKQRNMYLTMRCGERRIQTHYSSAFF